MVLSGPSPPRARAPLLHPPDLGEARESWLPARAPSICQDLAAGTAQQHSAFPFLLLPPPQTHAQAQGALQRLKFAEVQNKNSRNTTWVRPWLSHLRG